MKKSKMFVINFKNIIKYAKLFLLIFGSIIGVGFVSGAEIYEFFARFDNLYIGLITFFLLSLFIISNILSKNALDNSLKKQKNEVLNLHYFSIKKYKIRKMVTNFNVLLISGAMFSGLKNLLKNLLNNNYLIYITIAHLVIFIILLLGIKWLEKFDFLGLIFVFILLFYFIFCENIGNLSSLKVISKDIFSIKSMTCRGLFSAIFAGMYVFMNYFQVEPLVSASKIKLKSKTECNLFSLFFSLSVTFVLLIFSLVIKNNFDLGKYSMPLFAFFSKKSGTLSVIYIAGLVLSLSTTLLSCLISVKECIKNAIYDKNLCIKKCNNFVFSLITFLVSFLLGFVSFNFYISAIYPLLGIINFLIFLLF